MKITLTLAGVLLVGTSLAACSGGGDDRSDGDYCTDIAAAKKTFTDLSGGDLSKLQDGFATFHQLADESPSGLRDEWKTLDDAATSIEKALKTAGLTFDDLPKIQSGTIPEGVDVTKLSTFAADLQKLNNDEFSKARTAISDQAQKTCKVDLGAS